MSFRRITPAAVVAFALASACSSGSGSDASGATSCPVATATSASGAYKVSVCTSMLPPIQGEMDAVVTVTDVATGKAVDGLGMTVVPWMPAMDHGASVLPTMAAMGSGKYKVGNLVLFMAGEWELRLTIDGKVQDTANPVFDVP